MQRAADCQPVPGGAQPVVGAVGQQQELRQVGGDDGGRRSLFILALAPRRALQVEAGDQVLVFQFQEQAGQPGLRRAHHLVERLTQAGKMLGGAQRESLAVIGHQQASGIVGDKGKGKPVVEFAQPEVLDQRVTDERVHRRAPALAPDGVQVGGQRAGRQQSHQREQPERFWATLTHVTDRDVERDAQAGHGVALVFGQSFDGQGIHALRGQALAQLVEREVFQERRGQRDRVRMAAQKLQDGMSGQCFERVELCGVWPHFGHVDRTRRAHQEQAGRVQRVELAQHVNRLARAGQPAAHSLPRSEEQVDVPGVLEQPGQELAKRTRRAVQRVFGVIQDEQAAARAQRGK